MAGSAGSPPQRLTVKLCERGYAKTDEAAYVTGRVWCDDPGCKLVPVEYVPREQSDALAFDAFIAGFEYTGPVHAPRIREAAKDWLNSYREATQ